MEGQIPIWVAAVTAIVGGAVVPLAKMAIDWGREKLQYQVKAAEGVDAERDKLHDYLKKELEVSRSRESSCMQKYEEAMREISRAEARIARLEAIIAQLHPDKAPELLTHD